ncbi:MAG: hypothetical protein WD512_02315 [Candidatus Paceibacterota bacterium]
MKLKLEKVNGYNILVDENAKIKEGDMIARNPENHNDLWLVAKDYFEQNFEEINQN